MESSNEISVLIKWLVYGLGGERQPSADNGPTEALEMRKGVDSMADGRELSNQHQRERRADCQVVPIRSTDINHSITNKAISLQKTTLTLS